MSTRRMTPNELRSAGIAALQKALGPADTLRFLQLFDHGHGDYTAEREQILAGVTFDELMQELQDLSKPRP